MIALLASILIGTNSVTFTAQATGVDAGTAVEFLFVGRNSDRDYEAMFILDDSISDLAAALERAGLAKGEPLDARKGDVWPTGTPVRFEPDISQFVTSKPPEGLTSYPPFLYTGGLRDSSGRLLAATDMPAAFCAFFDCPQAPVCFNGLFPQGDVYGLHLSKETLKKGKKYSFKIIFNPLERTHDLSFCFKPQGSVPILQQIKAAAASHEVAVRAQFDDELSVAEATAVAQALQTIDSVRVKVTGRAAGDFFYRTFQPLVKWRDRKERLTQPFEVHVTADGSYRVLFIDEDWSGEGTDPRLIEKKSSFTDMKNHPKTDTCFFYCPSSTKLSVLKKLLRELPGTVPNVYVMAE